MRRPKVSIIVPNHNYSMYLTQCIESIRKQSYRDFELLFLDDASTDDSLSIISHYARKDTRIRILSHHQKQGILKIMSNGLRSARGEYIARLDSDDYWIDSEKLRKQVDRLDQDEHIALVGTWARAVNEQGEELYEIKYPTTDEAIRPTILKDNAFVSSSVLFRKKHLSLVTSATFHSTYADDFNLWLLLGREGKFCNIPEFETAYRINQRGITHTVYKKQLQGTIELVKNFAVHYPNATQATIFWNIRSFYPSWLKEKLFLLKTKTISV